MTRSSLPAVVVLPLFTALACAESQPYMLRLADDVAAWRERLPQMDASADRAAQGVIAGGNLYAFGPQPGFASEAGGRAAGLMMLQGYRDGVALTSNDTVMAAVTHGSGDAGIAVLLDKAAQAGAQVIIFGGGERSSAVVFSLDGTRKQDHAGVSEESMSHVAAMWAWTGRFIAKCVRHGRMPCVYQSYLLPGGRERGAFLQQQTSGRFHQTTAVTPHDADMIAVNYLTTVEQSLRDTWKTNQSGFEQAAALLRSSHENGRRVAVYSQGHLFPDEFDQPQQPDWVTPTRAPVSDDAIGAAIVLAYQATPWETLSPLMDADLPIILTCSQHALPEFDGAENRVYLDPHWPVTDGVVALPGYDVMLLPASGVMDAAVYWQLIELATAGP